MATVLQSIGDPLSPEETEVSVNCKNYKKRKILYCFKLNPVIEYESRQTTWKSTNYFNI